MRSGCLIFLVGCSFSTSIEEPDGSVQPSCDLDGDGACDDQTWRCSMAPSGVDEDPIFGNVGSEALWAHDVSLANTGRFVVAAAGKPLALTLRYDWQVDCPGPSCQAQVEIGVVATGVDQRFGCVGDRQMVDRDIEWNQNGTAMIVAPTAPGIYDVRLEISKSTACDTAWSVPAGNHTIAKICVP